MPRVEVTAENVDELLEKYAGKWLPACEIDKLFVRLCHQVIRPWARKGEIRRRRSRHKGVMYDYCVAEAITARHLHRQIKTFMFRPRAEDGVMEYRCNVCIQWKERDGFYENTMPSAHGLLTSCKTCFSKARIGKAKTAEQIESRSRSERDHRARIAAGVKKSAEWKPPELIEAKRILSIIEMRLPPDENSDTEISRMAGVDDDVVRNIRRRARDGGNVTLVNVDKLFTGLNWAMEMSHINEEIESQRPPWHPDHPYCRRCLRTHITYAGIGMCNTCYPHRDDPDWRPPADSDWSLRYARCITCEGTSSPYKANGRCSICDARWRRRRGKG